MPTALVIDHDQVSVSVLAKTLNRMGFYVLTTTDARGASWYCQQFKIDLVVAEVFLRWSATGTEVARTLRQACDPLPVLFVSETPMEQWPETDLANIEALLPGRVECLAKPFTSEALYEALSRLVYERDSELPLPSPIERAKQLRQAAGSET